LARDWRVLAACLPRNSQMHQTNQHCHKAVRELYG
jgi:hypothetical protein